MYACAVASDDPREPLRSAGTDSGPKVKFNGSAQELQKNSGIFTNNTRHRLIVDNFKLEFLMEIY